MSLSPSPDVRIKRSHEGVDEQNQRRNIHGLLLNVPASQRVDQEFRIRGGHIVDAQFGSHLPTPIRARAVTGAIPDAEDKSGKGRQENNGEIDQPCLLPDPAEENNYD